MAGLSFSNTSYAWLWQQTWQLMSKVQKSKAVLEEKCHFDDIT